MKRKLLLAAGLGVLLLIPLAYYLITRWTDIPPPDDSDLVLPERKVEPTQNPFPEIRSFQVDSETSKSIARAWKMIESGEDLDENFIIQLLNSQSETITRFGAYAEMRDWREDQAKSVDIEVPYLANWPSIAKLLAMESRRALRENRTTDALGVGMSILRFAEGLHHAEGGFVHQLSGCGIASVGMTTVLRVVETGRLSPEQLAGLARELAGLRFDTDTYGEAFIVEYLTFRKVADDLAEGTIHIHQLESSKAGDEGHPAHPPANFFYKRNKTVQLLADAYRQFILEIPMIRSEASGDSMAVATAMKSNSGALYFSGNLIGRILFSIVVPSGEKVTDTFAATLVSLELLRTRVAMERYRVEHGDWPDALDNLIPTCLTSVPFDLMDGEPIRYSKADRVLYSVGIDLVDNQGIPPDRPGSLRSRKEIVIDVRTDLGQAK